MSWNIEKYGLRPGQVVTILEDQLPMSDFEELYTDLHCTHVYQNDHAYVYATSSKTSVIHYSQDKKASIDADSTLANIFQDIKTRQDKKRFLIPLAEMRENSEIGHYTLLVIDRDDNGQYSATVYDSKTNRSLLALVIRFFAYILGISINGNNKIKNSLKNHLGTDVSYQRQYYHHQPSVLNNSCGAYTMRLLRNPTVISGEKIVIPSSNSIWMPSTSMLSAKDLANYRDAASGNELATPKSSVDFTVESVLPPVPKADVSTIHPQGTYNNCATK